MPIELVTARETPTAMEPAATQRRRLMAVMLADVVDYSGMMSRSEDETHQRFARHSDELIEPTIDKYNGRLVRSMGAEYWSNFPARSTRCVAPSTSSVDWPRA